MDKSLADKQAAYAAYCADPTPEVIAVLDEMDLEQIHGSNFLEGNPLTIAETRKILKEGLAVGDVKLDANNEAVGLAEALAHVKKLSKKAQLAGEASPIRQSDVIDIHNLLMRRVLPDIAGKYATANRHHNYMDPHGRLMTKMFPRPGEELRLKINKFADWLETQPDTPQTAFEAHRTQVSIHPFEDGNKRTSRLLMNLILMRGGFPPIVLTPENRDAYKDAMHEALVNKDYRKHDTLMMDQLHKSLDHFLDRVGHTASGGGAPAAPTRKMGCTA